MLRQFVQPVKLTEENIQDVLNWAEIFDGDDRRNLAEKLRNLVGPIPSDFESQYLTTYADRVTKAQEDYDNALDNVSELDEDYKDTLARASRQYRRALAIARTYRNDMENYAYALLIEWKKDGVWIP